MPAYFTPGRYLLRIEQQRFMESPREKTLAFVLTCRVLKNLDNPSADVKPFLRDLTLWIDDDSAHQVLHDLHKLGYSGKDLSGVDPDTPNHHSFVSREIEANCRHKESSRGDPSERWYLADPVKPNLGDKAKLRKFDRLLAGSQDGANGSAADNAAEAFGRDIDDKDVPF